MKVQSISNYNLYNSYNNRNLEGKEQPKPCFGTGTQTGRLGRRIPLFAALALAAGVVMSNLSSCVKIVDNSRFNFEFNDSISVNNIFKFNFNHTNNFIWNCNCDTIHPPLPPDDTITPGPGGDTIQVKPNEVFVPIFHDLFLPTQSKDSINDEQLQWPVAADTVEGNHSNFTTSLRESGSYQKYSLNRLEYDPANSTNVITAYRAVLKDNFNGIEYPCVSGTYKSTYNGEKVYVEMLSYDGKKPKGITIPDVIIHRQGVEGDRKTQDYYCDNNGNVLEVKNNFVAKGNDGQYYFRQQWGELIGDSIVLNGDQYFDVERTSTSWNNVPNVGGSKK